MNVFDAIRESARQHLDGIAVIDGAERLDYRTLLASVDAVAAELRSLGVRRERPVALLCDDSTEYIVVSLALLSVGAAIVPLPPKSRGDIDRAFEEIDPAFVVFQPESMPAFDGVALSSLSGRPCALRVHRRTPQGPLPADYQDLEAAFIRFSSGTTSESKGVVLSHRAILERTDAANAGLRITSQDRVLWVLSMSFHFVVTILLFLRNGATIVLGGGDFPASLGAGLADHEPTVLYASPFHYRLMISSEMFPANVLGPVRLAVCTAMSLPLADAESFHRKFGIHLSEAYGIIEIGLPFLNDARDPARYGSVGRALPGYEARIANPDESGVGEILVRGPGMFEAYFSPWRSAEEILDERWFPTGDLGEIDDDGFLHLRGRRKNVINFAGMKVFPEEVEAVLNRCPGVQESYVHARPHEDFGELPCADVVLESDDATNARKIRRFCYASLAWYKAPKEIRVVTEVIKTPSGKIRRWEPGAPT